MPFQFLKEVGPLRSGIAAAVLLLCSLNFSCSDSKKDNQKIQPDQTNAPVLEPVSPPTATPTLPVTTTPVVPPQTPPVSAGGLDYSGFRTPSFASLPWESKCEGIQSFMEDFGRKNLEAGVVLKFKYDFCDLNLTSDDLSFWVRVGLKKDEDVLDLEVRVSALFNWEAGQLEVKDTGVWRVDGVSTSSYLYQSKDSKFGTKLRLLPVTLSAWAKEKLDQETVVFGLPYREYADYFVRNFGSETAGVRALTAEFKGITLQFLPKENAFGQGSVKFLDADPRFFVDHTAKKILHLGCETLECLNSSKIQYQLLGKKLVLSGQPKDKENCRVETEYFSYTVEKTANSEFKLGKGLWGMQNTGSTNCGNT